MDAQTALDMVALAMTDVAAIELINTHMRYLAEFNDDRHRQFITMMTQAIDNMYGEGSYAKYCATGTLPSQQ